MPNVLLRCSSCVLFVASAASFVACDASEGDGAGGHASSTGAGISSSSGGERGGTTSSISTGCSVGTAGPAEEVCIVLPATTGSGAGGANGGGGGAGGAPGTGGHGGEAPSECPPASDVTELLRDASPRVTVPSAQEGRSVNGECCYVGHLPLCG